MSGTLRFLHAAASAYFLTYGLVGPPDPLFAAQLTQIDLDANRSLWESSNISNYDFVLSIGCFCDPQEVRPGIVSVRSDLIVSVIDAQTHEPRSHGNFLTIDNLFDRAQVALNSGDIQIDAEFDSTLGFPRLLRTDDLLLGDDDVTYTINSLTVVPEPSAQLIGLSLFIIGMKRKSRNLA
jgi:hypothetical protein